MQRPDEPARKPPGDEQSGHRHQKPQHTRQGPRRCEHRQRQGRADAEQPRDRRQQGERDRDRHAAHAQTIEIDVRVEAVHGRGTGGDQQPEDHDHDQGGGAQEHGKAGGGLDERPHLPRGRSHGRKTFHHPEVGDLTLGYQSMELEGTPGAGRVC
ncbi:hypothetical protein ABZ896_52500, partial [Streptomyces sp. NPDC047072]